MLGNRTRGRKVISTTSGEYNILIEAKGLSAPSTGIFDQSIATDITLCSDITMRGLRIQKTKDKLTGPRKMPFGFVQHGSFTILPDIMESGTSIVAFHDSESKVKDSIQKEIEISRLRQENRQLRDKIEALEADSVLDSTSENLDILLPSFEFAATKAKWTICKEEIHTWNFNEVD